MSPSTVASQNFVGAVFILGHRSAMSLRQTALRPVSGRHARVRLAKRDSQFRIAAVSPCDVRQRAWAGCAPSFDADCASASNYPRAHRRTLMVEMMDCHVAQPQVRDRPAQTAVRYHNPRPSVRHREPRSPPTAARICSRRAAVWS